MRVRRSGKALLAGVLLLAAVQIHAESISCGLESAFVSQLVDVARKSPRSSWPVANKLAYIPFITLDGAILPGWGFSPHEGQIEFPRELVVMLPGNAMLPDRLFELADKLVTNTHRRVLVYGYRGYAHDSKDKASLNALLEDTTTLLRELMASGKYDRGMVVGISIGGMAGLRALSALRDPRLRVLLDSTPVSLPWWLLCPSSIDVQVMATDAMLPLMGVVFGDADVAPNTGGAIQFLERVRKASGGVWRVKGQHAEIEIDVPGRLKAYEAFFGARN